LANHQYFNIINSIRQMRTGRTVLFAAVLALALIVRGQQLKVF